MMTMSQQAVLELIDRWLNDRTFFEEMRKDPEGTVRSHGFDLSVEEWEALHKTDWSLPDEELTMRVTKGLRTN
jgi:hypothetical protein